MLSIFNLEDHTGNSRRAKMNDTVAIEQLIRAAVTALKLPSQDAEGRPVAYGLRQKDHFLPVDRTLRSQNVRRGATLTLVPLSSALSGIVGGTGKVNQWGSFRSDPLQIKSAWGSNKGILESIQPVKHYEQQPYESSFVKTGEDPPTRTSDRIPLSTQIVSAFIGRSRLPATISAWFRLPSTNDGQEPSIIESIQPSKDDHTYVNLILTMRENQPARMLLERTRSARQIIPTIIARLKLPVVDEQGRSIIYYLRYNGHLLQDHETLEKSNITNDDTLIVERQLPDIISTSLEDEAGGGNRHGSGFETGSSMIELPTKHVSQSILISYHYDDFAWASRIATQVRADVGEDTSIIMVDCRLREGESFFAKEQATRRVAEMAGRIVVILSPQYQQSQLGQTPLHVAANRDPNGGQGLLLPVYVEDLKTHGFGS